MKEYSAINRDMKKVIQTIGTGTVILCVFAVFVMRPFLSKLGVRFILHTAEATTPGSFTMDERTVELESGTLRVIHVFSISLK